MDKKTRIQKIFAHEGKEQGLWLGNIGTDTLPIYLRELGLETRQQVYDHFDDDCHWVFLDDYYKHPEGKYAFGFHDCKPIDPLAAHKLANAETIAEVDEYDWPEAKYLDFTEPLKDLEAHSDRAIFSGMWAPFFHIISDIIGMEEYFCKMYTHPEVVEAITERVVDYYVEANERYFSIVGDKVDVNFFGNDFGTQLDLLISVEMFEKFIMPGFKRLIAVAKKYNKKILLHSCGAIDKVIPLLIDAGIDALHPLQALAKGMDAEHLAKEYKNDIAFVGGLDHQDLLPFGTPQQVRDEVHRLRDVFGNNYIVSPSHEYIQTDIPLENIAAMAEAARD